MDDRNGPVYVLGRAPVCTVEGCDKPHQARDMCGMHYRRWRLYGDPLKVAEPKPRQPDDERFWSKVEKGSGCWEWRERRDSDGYGRFHMEGKTFGAHRMAWTFTNGPIPQGLCVLHTCDNPPCCNPAHLFLGTIADNNADRAAKGRSMGPLSPEHRANISAAQRGRPFNHKPTCVCRVCIGRKRNRSSVGIT